MKPIRLLWIFYISAVICLSVQSYCKQQSLQYFDFKSLTGSNQAWAEIWLARAELAVWVGFVCAGIGSACAPSDNKWENGALAICVLCAYASIAILF